MSLDDQFEASTLNSITTGDFVRWAVAFILVAGFGFAAGFALQNFTVPPMLASASEPAILLDLAPMPIPEPADLIPAQPVDPASPPREQVIEPQTIQPLAPSDQQLLSPTSAPEPISQQAAIEPLQPIETQPAIEPEPVLPEPSLEPEPITPEPILSPQPPLEPESALPSPVVEPELETLLDSPSPVTMSTDLRRRREQTPPTTRRQPPRQQTAEPASRPLQQQQPAATSTANSVTPEQWQAQALHRINQHAVYPNDARQNGQTGSVLITFTVNSAGRIGNISVARSSGFPVLDQAAIQAARQASPLSPPPAGYANQTLSTPIRFNLR